MSNPEARGMQNLLAADYADEVKAAGGESALNAKCGVCDGCGYPERFESGLCEECEFDRDRA